MISSLALHFSVSWDRRFKLCFSSLNIWTWVRLSSSSWPSCGVWFGMLNYCWISSSFPALVTLIWYLISFFSSFLWASSKTAYLSSFINFLRLSIEWIILLFLCPTPTKGPSIPIFKFSGLKSTKDLLRMSKAFLSYIRALPFFSNRSPPKTEVKSCFLFSWFEDAFGNISPMVDFFGSY